MSKKEELLPYVDTNVNGFFSDFGIETEEHKTSRFSFFGKMNALIMFIVLSVIAGLIVSLIPVMIISLGAVAIEPPVEYWKSLPDELETITIAERNTLYDVNGDVFAQIWEQNRVLVDSIDDISPYAVRALIATEDQRFYEHGGFDPMGTARSAIRGSGGGSGITQQIVKNLQYYNFAGTTSKSEATEQSIERKMQELKFALKFEEENTKNEILVEYFNTVAFGAPNIYSIEAASQYFFSKKARDLDLAEATALVGTVQNAGKYNLNAEDPSVWKDRQRQVLERMHDEGDITRAEVINAQEQELEFTFNKTVGNCSASKYPFYCDYVMDYLRSSPKLAETQEERDAILARGGLHIQTHLDPKVMDIADDLLEKNFTNNNRVVAPVAIVEPGTGAVTGIAVNREYGEGEGKTEINVPLNATGTGSTYKMFALAAALNNGFTEEDLAFSSRCPLSDPNYDMPKSGYIRNSSGCGLQGGYLDYMEATAFSSNTWFTELTIKVGVENIKEFSANVGLAAPDNIGKRSISYTLGPVENSPVNMAAAFATFANEGVFCPATPVESFKYADGTFPEIPETYDETVDACKQVMSPYAAGVILKAMRANISGEIPGAFGEGRNVPGYDTAAKSGTNQLYNNAWAHVSKPYSLFINVYDMDTFTNGINYIQYKGRTVRWFDNAAGDAGHLIMKELLKGKENIPLKYESNDKDIIPLDIKVKDRFTVPSVLGMTPENAVAVLNNTGMTVRVSKDTVDAPNGFSSGVIAEQSISPGEQLTVGTSKEIILFIGEE